MIEGNEKVFVSRYTCVRKGLFFLKNRPDQMKLYIFLKVCQKWDVSAGEEFRMRPVEMLFSDLGPSLNGTQPVQPVQSRL